MKRKRRKIKEPEFETIAIPLTIRARVPKAWSKKYRAGWASATEVFGRRLFNEIQISWTDRVR